MVRREFLPEIHCSQVVQAVPEKNMHIVYQQAYFVGLQSHGGMELKREREGRKERREKLRELSQGLERGDKKDFPSGTIRMEGRYSTIEM